MRISKFLMAGAGAAVLAASGCSSQRTIEARIAHEVGQSCSFDRPCRIRLTEITPFKWDHLYAFKYTATQDDVRRATGTRMKEYAELQHKLIFIKDGKIVFQENERTNVEHPVKNEVVFDIPDSANYKGYQSDVVFQVSKNSSEAGTYYVLTETN